MIDDITLGCDPELFLVDGYSNHISAVGKFGGTKDEPFPITDMGHCMQEDNVALEFNIPPSADVESFNYNIGLVLDYLKGAAAEQGLFLDISSSAEFEDEQLATPEAQEFGCSSDYDAWTGMENDKPDADTNLRTCGGHIHIGYRKPSHKVNLSIVKAMDLFLGVPSLFMDDDVDRRIMYGKAGCFRPKEFGVEYRVLSNFWVADESLSTWAYNATIQAIEFINENGIDALDKYEDKIVKCINTNDKELATELMDKFNIKKVEKKKVLWQ